MRIDASIKGDLRQFMKAEVTAAEKAVTAGVKEVATGVKDDLRQQVESSGLGAKVAKAWQAKFYPSGKSLKAAGYVYTKAPKIVAAFNDGVTIKSAKGNFLAIPTPDAPKRGVDGKRISPSNFPEASLGKLRFVYRPGGISLLVIDNLRARGGKRGGFGHASTSALRSGRGLATVVMFILLSQVNLRKRLDVDAIVSKWEPSLGEWILANWQDEKSK